MSAKRVSPTASALRSSRLFSLPKPLPRPPEFIASNSFIENAQSTTATLPFPVQQAVTTSASARSRGDWGLKRAFPPRSARKTSNAPAFRINAVDTREHITDFDSATDLSTTRERFLELGLPVNTIEQRSGPSNSIAVSAFEPTTDNADPALPSQDPQDRRPGRRWRFTGPWLAGLSEQEFLDYVAQELYGRKDEFLAFLRQHESQRQIRDRTFESARAFGRGAQASSEVTGSAKTNVPSALPEDDTTLPSPDMSDVEFTAYLRKMRSSFSTASPLADRVASFLDLPSLAPIASQEKFGGPREHRKQFDHPADAYMKTSEAAQRNIATGPPRSHPAGGLSYLRTNAILKHHELYGAQSRERPIIARVLQREDPFPAGKQGLLGVAGFATEGGDTRTTSRHVVEDIRMQVSDAREGKTDEERMKAKEEYGQTMGASLTGGNRIYVEPLGASLDESGRVRLKLAQADEGMLDSRHGSFGRANMVLSSKSVSRGEEERQAKYIAKSPSSLNHANYEQAMGFKSKGGTYGIGKASSTVSDSLTETSRRPQHQQSADMLNIFDALTRNSDPRKPKSG